MGTPLKAGALTSATALALLIVNAGGTAWQPVSVAWLPHNFAAGDGQHRAVREVLTVERVRARTLVVAHRPEIEALAARVRESGDLVTGVGRVTTGTAGARRRRPDVHSGVHSLCAAPAPRAPRPLRCAVGSYSASPCALTMRASRTSLFFAKSAFDRRMR